MSDLEDVGVDRNGPVFVQGHETYAIRHFGADAAEFQKFRLGFLVRLLAQRHQPAFASII